MRNVVNISIEYLNALHKILLSADIDDGKGFFPGVDFIKNELQNALPVKDSKNTITLPKEYIDEFIDSIANIFSKTTPTVTNNSGKTNITKQTVQLLTTDTAALRQMKIDFQRMLQDQLGYSAVLESDKPTGKIVNSIANKHFAIRTFNRNSLYTEANQNNFVHSAAGNFGPKHFIEWMFGVKPINNKSNKLSDWESVLRKLNSNDINDPAGISWSLLPSRIFDSNNNRLAMGIVLPKEDDVALINKYTNKDFLANYPECRELSNAYSNLMTTITYFGDKDLFSIYNDRTKETIPDVGQNSYHYFKYRAQTYLNRIFDYSKLNEAIIKLRYSSTDAMGFFYLEDDILDSRNNVLESIKKGGNQSYYKYLLAKVDYILQNEIISKSNNTLLEARIKVFKVQLESLNPNTAASNELLKIETGIDNETNKSFSNTNILTQNKIYNFPIQYEKKFIGSLFGEYEKNIRFGNINTNQNLHYQDVLILDSDDNPVKFRMTKNDAEYKRISPQPFSASATRTGKNEEIKEALKFFFNLNYNVEVDERGNVKIFIPNKNAVEFHINKHDETMISWYNTDHFESTLKTFDNNIDLFTSRYGRRFLKNDSEKYFAAILKLSLPKQEELKIKIPDFINGLDYKISGANIVKLCDKFNIPVTTLNDQNIDSYIKTRFDDKTFNALRKDKNSIITNNIMYSFIGCNNIINVLKANFQKEAAINSQNIIRPEYKILLVHMAYDNSVKKVFTTQVRNDLKSLAQSAFDGKVTLSNDNLDNLSLIFNALSGGSKQEKQFASTFDQKYKEWVCNPKIISYSSGINGRVCATNIGKRKYKVSDLNTLLKNKPNLPENKKAFKRFKWKQDNGIKHVDRVSSLLTLKYIGDAIRDGEYQNAAIQGGASVAFDLGPLAAERLKNLKYQRYLQKAGLGTSLLGIGYQVHGLTQAQNPTEAALLGGELGLNALNIVLNILRVKSSFIIPLQVILLATQLGIDAYKLNTEIEKLSESYDLTSEEKRDEFWKRIFGMYSDRTLKKDLMHTLINNQQVKGVELNGREDYFLETFPNKGKVTYLQDFNNRDNIKEITNAENLNSNIRLVTPSKEDFLLQVMDDQFYTDKFVRAAQEVLEKKPNVQVSGIISELEKISNDRRNRIRERDYIANEKERWGKMCNYQNPFGCGASIYYTNKDNKVKEKDQKLTPVEKQQIKTTYLKIPEEYKNMIFSYLRFSNTGPTTGRNKFPPASLAMNPIENVTLGNKDEIGSQRNTLVCAAILTNGNQNSHTLTQTCEMPIYKQDYTIDQKEVMDEKNSNIYGSSIYSTSNTIENPTETLAFNLTSNTNLDLRKSNLTEIKGSFNSKELNAQFGEGSKATIFQISSESNIKTECPSNEIVVIDLSHTTNQNNINFSKYNNKGCSFHIIGKIKDNVNWNIKNAENSSPINILTENTALSTITVEGKTQEEQFIRVGNAKVKTTNPNSVLIFDSPSDHIHYISPEAELHFPEDFNLDKISNIESSLKDGLIYYTILLKVGKTINISSEPNYRLNFSIGNTKFISNHVLANVGITNNVKQFSIIGQFEPSKAIGFEIENTEISTDKIKIFQNKAIDPKDIIHFNDLASSDVKTIEYKGNFQNNSLIIPRGKNLELSCTEDGICKNDIILNILRFESDDSRLDNMAYFKHLDSASLTMFAVQKTPENISKLQSIKQDVSLNPQDLTIVKDLADSSIKINSGNGKLIFNQNGKFYNITFNSNTKTLSSVENKKLSTFEVKASNFTETRRAMLNIYDLITAQKTIVTLPFEFQDIVVFADGENNVIFQAGNNSVLMYDFDILSKNNITMQFVDSKGNIFDTSIKNQHFIFKGKNNFKTDVIFKGEQLNSKNVNTFEVKLSDQTISNAIINEGFNNQNFVFKVNKLDMKAGTFHILNRSINQDLVLSLPDNIVKFNSIRAVITNNKNKDVLISVNIIDNTEKVVKKIIHVKDAFKENGQFSGIIIDDKIIKFPDLSLNETGINDDFITLVDKIEITDSIDNSNEQDNSKIIVHKKYKESPPYSTLKYGAAGLAIGVVAGGIVGYALSKNQKKGNNINSDSPSKISNLYSQVPIEEESDNEETSFSANNKPIPHLPITENQDDIAQSSKEDVTEEMHCSLKMEPFSLTDQAVYSPVTEQINNNAEEKYQNIKSNTLRNTLIGAVVGGAAGAVTGITYKYFINQLTPSETISKKSPTSPTTEKNFTAINNSSQGQEDDLLFNPVNIDKPDYYYNNYDDWHNEANETIEDSHKYYIPDEPLHKDPEYVKNSVRSIHSNNPFSNLERLVMESAIWDSSKNMFHTFILRSEIKINDVTPEFDTFGKNAKERNLEKAQQFVKGLNTTYAKNNVTFQLNDGNVVKSSIENDGIKTVSYKMPDGTIYHEKVDNTNNHFDAEIKFPHSLEGKDISHNKFYEHNEHAKTLSEFDSKKYKTPGGLIINPSINYTETTINFLKENEASIKDGIISGFISAMPDIFIKDESMLKIGASVAIKLIISGSNIGLFTLSNEIIRTINLKFENNILKEKTSKIKDFDKLSKAEQEDAIKLIKNTTEYRIELNTVKSRANTIGMAIAYGFSGVDLINEVWQGNYLTATDKSIKLVSNYLGSKVGSSIVKKGIELCSKGGLAEKAVDNIFWDGATNNITKMVSDTFQTAFSLTTIKQDLPEPKRLTSEFIKTSSRKKGVATNLAPKTEIESSTLLRKRTGI